MSVLRRAALVALMVTAISGSHLALAAGSAEKSATGTAGKGESELLMAAETALREGKCRVATENYVAAARLSSQAKVAGRAAQLALACQQFKAASAAVARWLTLDKYSGEAALTAALVALKRYDLAEARKSLASWRESGAGGAQDPLSFAELLQQQGEASAVYRVFGDVLVDKDSAAEVHLAHARLAFAAQNMQVALEAARHALALEPEFTDARLIAVRAMSVMGEHDNAIAAAKSIDPSKLDGEDAFLLVDVLLAAERDQDADAELQRLSQQAATRSGATRRLISMAIRNGDLAGAERLIGVLANEREGTAAAVLFIAQLAERRGDDARAMQSYRLLADAGLALMARSQAARIMMKRGERESALQVLDEFAAQNPDVAIEVGATRAHLLAEAGDVDAALKGLEALEREYPDHPDLAYQRATVLETGGRTRAALTQFEQALKQRPDDPQLQNALGFTLADHKQDLARAEKLVRAAVAVSPDSAAIQDSLGWVLFRRGRTAEALPILARAWQNSGDAEIAAHYGEVLWVSGDEAQARYVWAQALNTEPGHVHLLAAMKRLAGEDAAAP